MKIKLSKKTKTFLWVVTALTTSTAVTTLLTSCSSAKENDIIDIGGYDREYGINDVTYARMEEDFKTLYKSQLDENKKSGKIDDSTYNLNLSTFQNNLNSIHTSLYSGENKTLSYTIRTNVLRDYARNNYGIRLSRQSNVSLSVTISGIKNSIVDSVLLLCKEYKIADDDTNNYRKKAEAEFEKLYTEAKSKYAEDDVVSIVQYIQNGMVVCFKGICKELDCLAAQQQLKDFISKYQISVREDITENYYWDKLLSKYGEGGEEISVEDFNSIFTMTYEETDPQSNSSSYFSTTKKTKEFRNDIITGYTLKPILAKMNSNPYTNVYSIDVDYTLVNNNYKDTDDVAKLTAHSSALKDKSFYENENISIFDLNANESEREYTNYVLPITKGYEEKQINETYFNNQDFKFSWSTSEEYGYNNFWTEPNENGEYKGKLNVSGLAASGMMINGVLLIDILNKAGKISLSGGSYQLNGIVKKADKDAKQWKLIIDGNEIKNEDISWKLVSTTTANLPDSIKINDGVVSWTDQIEAGTYNFSVLAIYKETKIQSPLITLTISSSEQSENTENLNYATKDVLYDEDTIDQKLIDFVNNVNFSLDYTENDYDTERDGKKGEINVDDFTIGYKNSKNTFEASNAINEAISGVINDDSGMTKRFSDSLWTHIKLNYDNANGIYDEINKLSTKLKDTNDELTRLLVSLCVISTSITLFYLTFFVCKVIYSYRREIIKEDIGLLILLAITVIVSLGILIPTAISLANKNSEVNNNLGTIKKDSKETQFSINLKNDYSYFYSNNDGSIVPDKSKYDKLSPIEVKKLKLYYSTYKNKETEEDKKTQSQKDYEEFLKLGNEDQNLHSYLDDYSEGLIIAGIVVASVLSIFMLIDHSYNIRESFLHKKIFKRTIETFAVLLASAIFTVLIFCSTIW